MNKKQKARNLVVSRLFKWWKVGEEILTNNAYDIYEMSPYLMEMHGWLKELDCKKQTPNII